ncbi:YciK family oxidoreductase [Catenovulum maritimum]|uniref:3-oxoacyl-ACP reductase n=1 Tax=Catenovulum maritimum TaxID=1513271 RepID=A0A0J8GVH7_9ALTE|nr:YciK family oxidoreductase [Catenovulum maritimum]KMT65314.1 3-oxoacyl-ACP reductase [Catenovulum maritimum]
MIEINNTENCLKGKTILVTGAGAGIGKSAAIHFSKFGAEVILLGKTTAKLEATYDEIVKLGYPEPAIIPLDLNGATKQNYLDMANTIKDTFGKLDGVLHNASSLGTIMPFEQMSEEMVDEIFKVNLTSQFKMTQALLPILKLAKTASVLFTSSGVGRKGKAFWGAYSISKFATEGMMQVLADEYDNTQIRFNSINPGATATKMRRIAFPAEEQAKLTQPDDIMPIYIHLMSDNSLNINGQALNAQ